MPVGLSLQLGEIKIHIRNLQVLKIQTAQREGIYYPIAPMTRTLTQEVGN